MAQRIMNASIAATKADPIRPEAPAGPLPAYRARVAAGVWAEDASQSAAAERLQQLWSMLRGYDPAPHPPERTGFLARWWRHRRDAGLSAPHGLYLVGNVGRGKSMLMDLFFEQAQVPRKRRIHFHRFMQDVHADLHAWKHAHPEASDPIPALADARAARAALLCFDEFQVNDIVDAMILGRLFQALFDRAVVVVATSNIAPDDLFRGQPGRDAFLPFIAVLKAHLDVVAIDDGRDFRRARLLDMATWHVPAGARAEQALDAAFDALTGHAKPKSETLTVMGRRLVVPLAAKGVARLDFQALCGQPLGAGDYLALAACYHAVILDAIPRLAPGNHDEARRFITLIDTLYDHRVKLVASADAVPDQLYERGEGARAFERTASRLMEMQSREYLALPHLS
jgi:cell division protein ZapE